MREYIAGEPIGRCALSPDDFLESEIAVALAATAALVSPRVRRLVQRGAVYGLAAAFSLGDRLASAVSDAVHAAQPANKDDGLEDITARR
jgi:hypothetical protein